MKMVNKIKSINIFKFWIFLRDNLSEYKKQILILGSLGFLSGILEGIGVNSLIPLFSIAFKQGDGDVDLITRFLKKFFNILHLEFNLIYLLIFILSLFVVRSLVLLLFYYIKIKITTNYEEDTRRDLLDKTLKAKWPHLLRQRSGRLEALLVNHIQQASSVLMDVSTIIMAISTLLVYVLIAVNISFLTTISVLFLGFVSLLAFRPLFQKTKEVGRAASKSLEDVAHHVNENLSGIKTVKYMGASDQVMGVGQKYFKKLNSLKVAVYMYKSFTPLTLQLVSIVFICAMFAFSYKSSYLSFGAMVALIYLIQRIFVYVQQLQTSLHGISENIPYLSSIRGYADGMEENNEQAGGGKKFDFKSSLSFEDVYFSYDKDKQILKGMNFTIHKGETVGLIGPSGSGKTTIVDLVLQLFKPDSGRILLDGDDVSNIDLGEWRQNIGYVSQDIFLIDDTITNNIKFYSERDISKSEIIEVAKKANIYDFIMTCPDKFNTVVGDKGVMLSAGQRQRIVIARILLMNPEILVFDEATSALDNDSERQIQEVIRNLRGEVTVLLIAHRLSTVMESDKILALGEGRIVEEGAAENLLADKDSYFFKMNNLD